MDITRPPDIFVKYVFELRRTCLNHWVKKASPAYYHFNGKYPSVLIGVIKSIMWCLTVNRTNNSWSGPYMFTTGQTCLNASDRNLIHSVLYCIYVHSMSLVEKILLLYKECRAEHQNVRLSIELRDGVELFSFSNIPPPSSARPASRSGSRRRRRQRRRKKNQTQFKEKEMASEGQGAAPNALKNCVKATCPWDETPKAPSFSEALGNDSSLAPLSSRVVVAAQCSTRYRQKQIYLSGCPC